MKMIKQPTIPPMPKQPTFDARDTQYNLPIGTDLISRAEAIKDAELWVAVDEYEKHLQKNVVEWLKEFPSAEHGTNLAEVGTDVPDTNVGDKAQLSDKGTTFENGGEIKRWSKDIISRQVAIDAIEAEKTKRGDYLTSSYVGYEIAEKVVAKLPPAEPKIGKWIDDGDPLMLKCGNCGYGVMRYNATHFCPNCGQKKEVEHDG